MTLSSAKKRLEYLDRKESSYMYKLSKELSQREDYEKMIRYIQKERQEVYQNAIVGY